MNAVSLRFRMRIDVKNVIRLVVLILLMLTKVSQVSYAQDRSGNVLQEDRRESKENKLPKYAEYTNIYQAIADAIPEAQRVGLGNRQVVFILRGNTTITGNNYARYAVNGLLVDYIDHIALDRVTRIYKMSNTQASIFGSQASCGIICIITE